ncbi:alpha/beta fold hydrolase [Pararhodobacter marinus]|uniref:alpha/beta fold hydrolase n=1 Tax=Pararhodobacter marinus TaxID=2184063 RepID=UPI00351794A1
MTQPRDLAYDADPESDRPPLLMVHGFLSSRQQWLPNAALSRDFRLVRVDLPGHGASPPPRNAGEACPEYLVGQLDRLRQALDIERWHLCGHSFGAGLTLRYALDFPHHCGGHVFTNANAALRGALTEAERAAYAAQLADLRAGGAPALARMRYHPRHARGLDPALQARLVADADKVDPEGFALLLEHVLPRLSVRERLEGLRVPVLLVNGLRERRFQPLRHWLAGAQPRIRILDLDGGHSINLDCAGAFNEAVRDFLLPLTADALQDPTHG